MLITIAVFLRFYRLPEFTMFLSDQGRDAIILKKIISFQHFPAIGAPSSVGQVYLGPFYYYLIAPFLLLFQMNPVGMSYGCAILSLFGIWITYKITEKEFGNITALLFAIFLIFSSVTIEMSRFSWNPNLLPYFAFITLYLFYCVSKKLSVKYAVMFGAFFGFSLQLHYLAAILALPIGIYFIIQFLQSKQKIKYLFLIFISVISFVTVLFPLVIFDLRHNSINSQNFLKLFSQGGVFQNASLISRISDVSVQVFQYVFSTTLSSIFVALLSVFTLVWTILFIRTKISHFFYLNIFNIVFFICAFGLFNSPRHPHYYGQIYLSIFLVLAILFSQIYSRVKHLGKFIVLLFMVGYFCLNAIQYYFLYTSGNNQILHSKKVAESLAQKIDRKPYNIATLPVELTEDNYVYFLELLGLPPADRNKVEITQQMYVLCNKKPCDVLESSSWNITMFGPAKIDTIWEIDGITIYKLTHNIPKNKK